MLRGFEYQPHLWGPLIFQRSRTSAARAAGARRRRGSIHAVATTPSRWVTQSTDLLRAGIGKFGVQGGEMPEICRFELMEDALPKRERRIVEAWIELRRNDLRLNWSQLNIAKGSFTFVLQDRSHSVKGEVGVSDLDNWEIVSFELVGEYAIDLKFRDGPAPSGVDSSGSATRSLPRRSARWCGWTRAAPGTRLRSPGTSRAKPPQGRRAIGRVEGRARCNGRLKR